MLFWEPELYPGRHEVFPNGLIQEAAACIGLLAEPQKCELGGGKEVLIQWEAPLGEWVPLNADGASKVTHA